MKAANTGRKHAPEVNQRKADWIRGKKQSAEHVEHRVQSRLKDGWFKVPDIGERIKAGRAQGKQPDVRGAKNGMWKGGIADETQRGRGTQAYAGWRAAVLDRANYACEQCGSTNHVVAHHRWSWANHPELRFNLENGIALCRLCHAKEHELVRNLNRQD